MLKLRKELIYIKNKCSIEFIILGIIFLILVNSLFINPIIGKYDNGDFARLMIYGGLSSLPKNSSNIYLVYPHYLISSPNYLFLLFSDDWVSGSLLLKVAVVICLYAHNFIINIFDIRYLGLVYSSVFLFGIFLILKFKNMSSVTKCVAGIFIIIFFTDVSYIEYFNSLYGEAGTIVFFFLNIGTYLTLITKDKPKIRYFIYFFVSSGAFLTSKAQELPLLFFMYIVYLGLFFYYKEKKYRKCILICSLLVTMLCMASYFSLSDTINENNVYQSVFSGVLKGSKNPKNDLQELGLNKKFIIFFAKKISFYNRHSTENPLGQQMLKEFYPRVSPVKILSFYIKNPSRLWEKVQESANNAYGFVKPSAANFQKGQYDTKKYFNTFRTKLVNKYPELHHNIYLFIIFSVIYFSVVMFYFIRYKDNSIRLLMLMLLFILASGSSQFILPVIGSGHGDFQKHLFLLNLSYDIMFGISVVWISHGVEVILNKFYRHIIK